MESGKGWLDRWGADRLMTAMVIGGVILGALVLWYLVQRNLDQSSQEIVRSVTAKARILDNRLDLVVSQLQVLRRQADQFGLERTPAPQASPGAEPPRSALLTAFLNSNPGEASAQFFSLDEVPPPYRAETLGNMVALTTLAARRRAGLFRPDPDSWQEDAALGLALLPAMSAMREVFPDLRRVYFAAGTGLVAFSPREQSATSRLLDSYPTSPVFRAAARDTDGQAFWSFLKSNGQVTAASPDSPPNPRVMGIAPETYTTVGLPLTRDGTFIGILAAQIDLASMLSDLLPVERPSARLVLADRQGNILADIAGEETAETPVPALSPALMESLENGGASHDHALLTVAGLEQAPLVLVHVVQGPSMLLPHTVTNIKALGVLLMILGLLLWQSQRMRHRAVAERNAAVLAETNSRTASETALADLRAAHDELDFLNREKTRFFSLISHDLRGPFNALLGMTQELAEYAPRMKPDDVADFARSTHQSARKVFELLENLLQWSRVQMSGKPFAPSAFALRDLVADAIRDVQSAAEAKDITVLDAVGDRWVLADRTMILAVLRNLLVNAVKFSHPGGLIHITSRALTDQLEVAVTDQGIGMEKQQVDLLLRSVAGQASRPGTQGEVGTGLGLTLVRDLILRHGGELKVSSEPGAGTVVSFSVPLTAPADQRHRTTAAAAD